MHNKFIEKFNTISFSIVAVIAGLLPFMFLPATIGGLGAAKGVLLYVGVFLAFSFWLVAQFIEGTFCVSRNPIMIALGAWVVLSFVSALTSANGAVSLWGRGFALDSFATTLVIALFTFLVATHARNSSKLIRLFFAMFLGGIFTVFLQIVLYVSQNIGFVATYFGTVANQGTLVGSWVDFSYFVSFVFFLSLLVHEVLMPKQKFLKIASLAGMALSLIVLIFLNFKAAWIIAIVSSLIIFVYKSSIERIILKFSKQNESSTEQEPDRQRFPLVSFISLLVGFFFFLSAGSVGAGLAQSAGVSFSDVRPSVATTLRVTRSSLAHDPVFGAGAGRYADVWNLYHPVDINRTVFWNTPFESGFNMFFTILTTNGILVMLALLALIVLSYKYGFRLLNSRFSDASSRFIAITALIIFLAFTVLFFFTSPGLVLIMMGFLSIGMLVGLSDMVGNSNVIALNYLRDPRTSFFAILTLVIATMAGFAAVFFSGNRFASIVVYNRALAAADFQTAAVRIDNALSLSQNDIFLRTRTALYTAQFSQVAATENPDKAQLQGYFSQAEQSARAAVAWDSTNANNWLVLSQVYQLVAGGNNAEAYTNGKQAADESQKRNPNNPIFLLNQAQLALTKQDAQGASAFIDQALALKNDYLDAYILRARIRIAAGETRAAVDEIGKYIAVAPFDDQGYVLLGRANLELKDYSAALSAFNSARQLTPNNPTNYLQYISALEVSGNKTQAISELNAFKTRFPTVQGVDEQIARMQSANNAPVTAPTTPAAN
jgi:cytochrome c-type biogenesis protein CcmH/NrfG